MTESLSIRVNAENPSHHLWKNGETWWINYTVHTDDGRKRRVRYSLGTRDFEGAKLLRDAVFAVWAEPHEVIPNFGTSSSSRIEVALSFDGLTIQAPAPDSCNSPLLARIDRGINILGTIADDFYVSLDKPWGASPSLVLWLAVMSSWLGLKSSQMENYRGYIIAVARVPLEDFCAGGDRDSGMQVGAAHLLHAWIASQPKSYEEINLDRGITGGEVLDHGTVRSIVERARLGFPL